ncbi:MAG TPA: type I glutamate--ammonia ligase [Thermodesulfobacteriota bacterium]|nr:type I glutamate--ammonia ligase [Thermodesulfobacteriota bacterium]
MAKSTKGGAQSPPNNANDVLKLVKDENIQIIDFRFLDFVGMWQHFSTPTHELDKEAFEEGLGFDGSSIRGWQSIHASDMLMIPDPKTARIDPFTNIPTLALICDIVDPITREPYSRDPRNIAKKAVSYLQSTGIADTAYFGPELEFFILDDVRYDQTANTGYYFVDSVEGIWNSGTDEGPNLGYKPRHKEGYFPCPPTDSYQDLRSEMVLEMENLGIAVEAHHHEVSTAGQAEIDMRFSPLVDMGDNMMWYKYICRNVARKYGKTVTFMPKVIFEDNGSGMHIHQSLWKKGKPLFAGNSYAGMSEMAMHYIGGILKHAKAICAFSNPTTNSYRRLVPGFEAPVNLAYSARNRSAAVRIPMYSPSPKAKRLETRFPDPSANGYLTFSAMLMAGLDGIENKIDPGDPLDKDIYSLGPEELEGIPYVPGSLEEALNSLKEDHEFLTKGDTFTDDVVETWIDYKMENEVNPVKLRPVPHEFMLYFDV